jgi:hypothetical protein
MKKRAVQGRESAALDAGCTRRAVNRVPDDGVTNGRHVDTNLVGSAAVQLDFEQGELSNARKHAPVRPRGAPLPALCGHPGPPVEIAGHGEINVSLCLSDAPVDKS